MSKCGEKFKRLPELRGLFYDPCHKQRPKKYRCPDCHFCQECSPSRCNVCREAAHKSECKLTLREQIALYEQTNSEN